MSRDVRVAILGDSRDFARAVKSAQHDANKLDHSFSGIGASAARMGKAVALGIGAVAIGGAALAKGFVDAAIESQKVTKQTEAVLKSMGGTAGVTAQQVSKLSTKLSLQTGIDDELIQSGQNLLLTFGKIRNEAGKGNQVFNRATQAALNLSVAMGTDMKSASILVGKALNDPIKGLTSMTRAGIQFTDQQKEQIKTMVAAGDSLGAQKIILGELDKQFGGSAAAQATASDKLKVAWGNVQEQLGEKLLPVVEQFSLWLAEKLPGAMATAEQAGRGFLDWIKENETLVKGLAAAAAAMAAALVAAWALNTAAAAAASVKTAVAVGLQVAQWVGLAGTAEASSARISAAWTRTLGPAAAVIAAAEAINRLVGEKTPNKSPLQGGGWNPFKGMSFDLPGFALGGMVPGAMGAPQLAVVHGGERVQTPAQQAAGGTTNHITIINPTPERASESLPRELRSLAWQLGAA